jgi:hypothetical protein
MEYILKVLQTTGIHLLLFFGPLLVLGVLMHFISGWNEKLTIRLTGQKGYLILFAWLGTPVHELGHALFALLFGHKIEEIKLFSPDPKTGTLGYVKHSWNKRNLYHITGNFFIGVGPLILGTLVLFLAVLLLYEHSLLSENEIMVTVGSYQNTFQMIGNSIRDFLRIIFTGPDAAFWKTALLFYLLFCVGGSLRLSRPDISGAAGGFIFIVLIFLLFNLATLWSGDYVMTSYRFISGFLGGFYLLIILSLMINLFFGLILWIFSIIKPA